ncbi:MAG: hypothetical protein ACE5IF_06175 [Candidatus Bathyarchaeia archaeon]
MKNWNGRKIQIAKSKGGKVSVCNYEDNLIIPPNSVWPHPDIVKKLYRSTHGRDFAGDALRELSSKLGFYCDLQSLRSEDAITWSVFGTLQYFPKESQTRFINSVLEKIDKNLRVDDCFIQLWTRISHPDTLVSGGPELDFQIVGDRIVIFGESKWTSKIAKDQGKMKDKNQIQLRTEFLQKYGSKIFNNATELLTVVVGLSLEKRNTGCHYITWREVCTETLHPLEDEVERYYLWKNEHGR